MAHISYWREVAAEKGMESGMQAARSHAIENGVAVVHWPEKWPAARIFIRDDSAPKGFTYHWLGA